MIALHYTLLLAAALISHVTAVPVWGQCGGSGYSGPTNCDSGSHCVKLNDYYSQCQPGDDSTSVPPPTTITTATTSTSTTNTGPQPTGTIITLPLGDSITYGLGTNDSNSYRLYLKNLLTAGGWNTDYVGTVKSGQMADNDNEGHSGATIDQISGFSDPDYALNPKVVILHAGTNDMIGSDVGNAPARLMQLVDKILTRLPDSALIVSTIIALPLAQSQVDAFNAAILPLLQQRVDAGNKLVIVSMSSVNSGDLSDGVHPNNNGYQKMAEAWYGGWQSASQNGWV